MIQLILHLVGDYVTQSDWMANEKTKRMRVALIHSFVYMLPFLILKPSHIAFFVMLISHMLIDRYRLARYVVFAKNCMFGPGWQDWEDCKATGYPSARPAWLAVWLLIAADNTIHLAINYAALRWL